MKTLHLIRHAKSSWDEVGLADIHRPLSRRGESDCGIMAAALFAAGVQFKQVYCSVAQRARLTIQGLADDWPGQPIEWQTTDALYSFSSTGVWQWVNGLDDDFNEVFLVGHNPAFTDFINEAGNEKINNLPTCGYVKLTFPPAVWADVCEGTATSLHYLKPKMFK